MNFLKRYRWIILGVGVAAVVVTFLALRPDKLFVDDAVDESLSDAFTTETTEVVNEEPAQSEADPSSATTVTTTTPPETSAPQTTDPTVVAAGDFFGVDHSAVGTATIYEQDGKQILRFEDGTDIQNGPDLYVWVLESDGYEGGTPTAYLDLGKLKGNVGGQNYELPAEYDPAIHQTVLIWCLRFSTPFAAAPLS